MQNRILLLGFFLLTALSAVGQNAARQAYIQEYAQIAVDEMNRSGIPASITLAQGILESGNGLSELATKANNHFGIKCHSSWDGPRVYHDDDEAGECFRKYKNARTSYEDHTDFLMRGSRYDFLFELDRTDYKAWARGLKQAGYATAPDYADRLIKIIEEESLHRYDLGYSADLLAGQPISTDSTGTPQALPQGPVVNAKGKPVRSAKKRFLIRRLQEPKKGTPYVVLMPGESMESLSDSLHLSVAALLAFNDMTWESQVAVGDKVYVDYKRNRGVRQTVVVGPGQSMWKISQQEDIQLKKLYRYNDFQVGQQPQAGTQLRLRPLPVWKRLGQN